MDVWRINTESEEIEIITLKLKSYGEVESNGKFQFAHLYAAAYDFVKLYAGCIFLCYYIRKNGGIVIDLDGYVKSLEQQGLSPAGIETRKRMLKDAG